MTENVNKNSPCKKQKLKKKNFNSLFYAGRAF